MILVAYVGGPMDGEVHAVESGTREARIHRPGWSGRYVYEPALERAGPIMRWTGEAPARRPHRRETEIE